MEVARDPSDFKLVCDPIHLGTNVEGYMEVFNMDLIKEMSDAIAANQVLPVDITAFNVLKQAMVKELEIGK